MGMTYRAKIPRNKNPTIEIKPNDFKARSLRVGFESHDA